jgi:hypothetical protein
MTLNEIIKKYVVDNPYSKPHVRESIVNSGILNQNITEVIFDKGYYVSGEVANGFQKSIPFGSDKLNKEILGVFLLEYAQYIGFTKAEQNKLYLNICERDWTNPCSITEMMGAVKALKMLEKYRASQIKEKTPN